MSDKVRVPIKFIMDFFNSGNTEQKEYVSDLGNVIRIKRIQTKPYFYVLEIETNPGD